jgi:hypothetical protein
MGDDEFLAQKKEADTKADSQEETSFAASTVLEMDSSEESDAKELPGGGGTAKTSVSEGKSMSDLSSLGEGIDRTYDGVEIPTWGKQLTFRAFFVALILGILFTLIIQRLNLTVGVVPTLNVAAGLFGFLVIKGYTAIARRLGLKVKPFTRQENTVIQTCVVACYTLAFTGNDKLSLTMSCSEIVRKNVAPSISLAACKSADLQGAIYQAHCDQISSTLRGITELWLV